MFRYIAYLLQFVWLNKVVFYFAVIAGCIVAFSPADAGLQPQMNDKFLHTVGFFVMAALSHFAHPRTSQVLLFIGLAVFGFAIELIQAYLPYRMFSLWDWCADIFGVAVYFLVISQFVTSKLLPD